MILKSEIIDDSPQHDGRRHIRERHTDHTGKTHDVFYTAEADADVATYMSERVGLLEDALRDEEVENLRSYVMAGQPIEFVHCTREHFLRAILPEMLSTDNAYTLLHGAPLMDAVSDSELLACGLSPEQVTAVRARVSMLKAYKAELDSYTPPIGGAE